MRPVSRWISKRVSSPSVESAFQCVTARSPRASTLRSVDERGDRAVTHWKALSSDGELTLLEIHLETGRTHQIRVHFAHLGAPLLGDRMYGRPDVRMDHQALHCGALTLIHPVTGVLLQASAPMPPEMAAVAQTLLCEKAQ